MIQIPQILFVAVDCCKAEIIENQQLKAIQMNYLWCQVICFQDLKNLDKHVADMAMLKKHPILIIFNIAHPKDKTTHTINQGLDFYTEKVIGNGNYKHFPVIIQGNDKNLIESLRKQDRFHVLQNNESDVDRLLEIINGVLK